MTTTTYPNAIRIATTTINYSSKVMVACRIDGDYATFRIYPWRRSSATIWNECREVAEQIATINNEVAHEDRFGFIVHTKWAK